MVLLSQALINHGFVTSQVDYSIFTFHYHDIHTFLLVYKDDIIIIDFKLSFIMHLVTSLQADFAFKDIRTLN